MSRNFANGANSRTFSIPLITQERREMREN